MAAHRTLTPIWFGARSVVVVLVLVAGHDAEATAHHLQQGILREFGVAGVVEGGEGQSQTEALVERAEGKQPASPENCPGDGFITSGVPKKSRFFGQAAGILTACLPREARPFGSPDETRAQVNDSATREESWPTRPAGTFALFGAAHE
jgi:hypothetical protein